MPLHYLALIRALLSKSPFSKVRPEVLVPGKAVGFHFFSQRFEPPLYASLDGWPDAEIGRTAFIRFATQCKGCTLGCRSCGAPLIGRGGALTEDEIVFQVLHILASNLVRLSAITKLVLATMGYGEPFTSNTLIAAIARLRALFPKAKFIVSATGIKTGLKVFEPLVKMARSGDDVDLQASIHSVRRAWRLGFVGDFLFRGRPLKTWTLEQMSALAARWFNETGRRAHVNLAVGPQFHAWDFWDFREFLRLFPPRTVVVKLSLEGPREGMAWDFSPFMAVMERRQKALRKMGYEVYIYIPEGVGVGASCGAHTEAKSVAANVVAISGI